MKIHTHFCKIFSFLADKKIYLFTLLGLQVIAGSAPILIAWANGQLIDTIALGTNVSVHNIFLYLGWRPVFFVMLVALAVTLSELATVWHNFFSDYFKDLIYKRIFDKILSVVSRYPTCELLESPKEYEKIILAKENASAISDYVSVGSQVLIMIFSVISAILLSLTLAWWIPFLLLFTMIPLIFHRTKIENKAWGAKETYAGVFNRMRLYDEILTSPVFAKEMRLYNIQSYVLSKWNKSFRAYFEAMNKVRFQGALSLVPWSFLSWFGPFIAYFYVSYNALNGKLSLGHLSYLFGIIFQIRGSLTGLMYNSSDVIKTFAASKPLLSLIDMRLPSSPELEVFKVQKSQTIQFQNVNFKYPGSNRYVFKEFSLELNLQEKIAIVGQNGSGKSTLVKLLCGFFPLERGQILWNGTDISAIKPEDLRQRIGVLFQDFSKFPLSLKENLMLDQADHFDDAHYVELLETVGLQGLKESLDCPMSKSIHGGLDLSGGQWQCIALARLLGNRKNKKFLILDEPTAAIDPHAEYDILGLLKNIMDEQPSILISHRLSMCRFVDRILVLKNGQIIEDGSHENLTKVRGEYAAMFQKQASWFVDGKSAAK